MATRDFAERKYIEDEDELDGMTQLFICPRCGCETEPAWVKFCDYCGEDLCGSCRGSHMDEHSEEDIKAFLGEEEYEQLTKGEPHRHYCPHCATIRQCREDLCEEGEQATCWDCHISGADERPGA